MGAVELELTFKDGDLTVRHYQDCEDIIESNKRLQSDPQKSDWGRHIASIPNVILVQWLNEEYARGNTDLRMFTPDFNALVARKLRDPDWKHLRVDQ